MGSHADRLQQTEHQRHWCGSAGKAEAVRAAVAYLRGEPHWIEHVRPSQVVAALVYVVPRYDESLSSWCDRLVGYWVDEARRAAEGGA